MGGLMLIEVLGRGEAVVSRTRVTSTAATIGRAYDNLVILDDAYADAHAACVNVGGDGSLSLVDLNSTNGLFGPDGACLAGEARLQPGDEFRVGRTRLRVVRGDTPVPAALREPEGFMRSMTTSHLGVAGSVVALLVVALISLYLANFEEFTAAEAAGELVLIGMGVAVWAGLWALATRMLRGHGHFLQHAAISCWIIAVLLPATASFGVVAFLWPGTLTNMIVTGVGACFVALLLHVQLGVSSRLSARVRAARALESSPGSWGWACLTR